ncbi:MAG: hypothetical protein OXC38_06885, partial [Gammaproteobacteria bacterium]|nr:hypothetical protein [Gammaproteobacteria bacterium]
AELWAQCRDLELPLPQPRPVSPSALTQARAKIDPALFRALHAEVLRRSLLVCWTIKSCI